MADVTYTIRYVTDNAKALKGIAELDAALVKLMATEQKAAGMLKAMGQNAPGLKLFAGEAKKTEALLRTLLSEATRAAKGLADVGKDNRAVTALTSRLKELEAELKAMASEAMAAQAALQGVGNGVNLPGGGGGGAPGQGGGRRVSGLGRAMALHVGMKAAGYVGRAIGDSLGNRRQYFSDTADLTAAYRKDLQPLAVLQGKTNADESVIRADLDFQKRTLLNAEDASTFRLEYGGAIAPALKARGKDGSPNITPEVAKELELEAAKLTARYGLDATTGGRMAGLLGVTTKVPNAATGVGIMEQALEQLNVEGVGPVKGMASHLLSLSGTMLEEGGGRFQDYTQMAARMAASTVNQAGSAARAKTRIVQSDRLLRKLAYDEESELGLKAKIRPEDDYETAIRKLEPHIKGDRGDRLLKDSGYANSTERIAVIEEAKMNSIVDKQLEGIDLRKSTARATAKNEEFPTTITGRQQAAENAEFATSVENGLAGERLKMARTTARARMADPNQPGGQQLKAGFGQSILDMSNSAFTMGGISGEDLRVDREAMYGLIEGGRKVGVNVRALAPSASFNADKGMPLDTEASRKEFNQAYEAVTRAGGDPMGGAPKRAAQSLRKAADDLDAMGREQGGPGGAGGNGPAPPPPPVGNGGAGVNPGRR